METLITCWRNGQIVQKGIPVSQIDKMEPSEAQALGAKPALTVEMFLMSWDNDIQYEDELEIENGKDVGKKYKVIADPEIYSHSHTQIQAERIVENARTTK